MTTLQTVQNQALRTVTGCDSMSSESHLHDECKILTVRDHCILLIHPHLIKCEDYCHPNNCNFRSENTDRARQVRFDYRTEQAVISHLTVMIRGSTMGIREALSWVHSNIVSGALRDRSANAVLDRHLPLIPVSEKTLPRLQGYTGPAQVRFFKISKQLLGPC